MSIIELVILALVFLVSLSIVWGSLRVGITPVPSSPKARQEILKTAAGIPKGTIIELGSGWGQLALALAKQFPERQVIGYELSLIPWLVSVIFKRLNKIGNLRFERKNFLKAELPPAVLLTCYLYPKAMQKLAVRLKNGEVKAERLISNTFNLPGVEPVQITRLNDLYRSPIYLYHLSETRDREKRYDNRSS